MRVGDFCKDTREVRRGEGTEVIKAKPRPVVFLTIPCGDNLPWMLLATAEVAQQFRSLRGS